MASHIHDDSPFSGEVEDRIPSWIAVVPPILAAVASLIVMIVVTLRMRPWE